MKNIILWLLIAFAGFVIVKNLLPKKVEKPLVEQAEWNQIAKEAENPSTYKFDLRCKDLPASFKSYTEAISKIKEAKFKIKESANTSGSSWVTSANFYSCDGESGFLIYTTNKGYEYIHQGLPISIWNGFKNASSKGSYYNANIKRRYQLRIE
jgi:hypothetical protein